MIGFDFDGVFVSDLDYSLAGNNFKIRDYQKPIFEVPDEIEYIIITGRYKDDKESLLGVINKFRNPPKAVYCDNDNIGKSMQYKAKIINELNLQFFVESDYKTAEYLKQYTKCNIYLFETIIEFALRFYFPKFLRS